MSSFGTLLLLSCVCYVNALRPEEVAVVVLSQGDSYHSSLALELKHDLLQQSSALGENKPKIFLTHMDFPHVGAWVVTPISSHVLQAVGPDTLWFIFCEERTRFNLGNLLSVLSHHNPSKEIWLGHGLSDKEPTIVHHFQIFPKAMQYPLLASGFAVSAGLMKRIDITPKHRKSIFSIDAMYELALRVNHTSLLSLPSVFCLENNHTECATYPLPFIPCGEPVPNEDLYFAVKTCLKFHNQRVPVIQNTWGKDASNIEFFSDVEDESIPTTSVGIANLAFGHCAKTKEILKLALKRVMQSQNVQWVVLTDDDTLLSVPRLRDLLSCWAEKPVVIGERYGFEVYLSSGYNYLTGGAGIAISSSVLPTLVKELHCYSDTAPDDMAIGSVLTQLGINIVHSSLFHQARPMDYPPGYLATQEPISFHKYWEVDPFSVYERWFASHPQASMDIHTEL